MTPQLEARLLALEGEDFQPGDIAEEFDITQEQIAELLLDLGLEACPTCNTVVESCLLLPPDDDEPDEHCDYCRD